MHRVAEVLEGRRLGESALGTQEGDVEGFFQGEAGGHDLPEQARHLLGIQRAWIALLDLAQDLRLALGTIELGVGIRVALDLGHRLGTAGPLADQPEQFIVQGIDARPDLFQ